MKKTFKTILLGTAAVTLLSLDLPKGWFKAGSEPDAYEMGIDKNAAKDGRNAATIRSLSDHTRGFGTLMQNSEPGKYLGKRVRMTGYMRSENVTGWAGFWLRTDGGNKRAITFDNMGERPVKGTTDWKKYEIVLDVPRETTNIAYGALLNEEGQVWFDDIQFEIVDNSVPLTGNYTKGIVPKEPTNLSFEE